MSSINITFPDNTTLPFNTGVIPQDFIERLTADGKKPLAVKVNNQICSLTEPIEINAKVEGVFNGTKEGCSIYRRSLCFVLATACRNIFPKSRLLVGHSLGYGYYYTVETCAPLTDGDIALLETEMRRIIRADKLIETKYLSYADACRTFEGLGLKETHHQLKFNAKSRIAVNQLENFTDLYFGPLVNSTGVLNVFALKPYQEGFLLRFPSQFDTENLPEFNDEPKLFEIYSRYKKWGSELNVTSAAGLNQLIFDKKINEFITITETLQMNCIAEIARKIQKKETAKVVLIAGPSSSGKTTTSKKLAIQLQSLGYTPKVISLDNYYVGREQNPKDENGNYDYECLEALDVKQLNQDLLDLFAGKEIDVPQYDFDKGERFYNGTKMKLGKNHILIMEGIHGLNDKLTPLIPAENKFKIYLSALTQLNLDDHNRIPTSDNRLIRRIVRDYNFRGKSAAKTISMWASVQKGERLHIFPFQNNADAMLNTALDYELSVLKVYAMPLLRCVTPEESEYAEASRLIEFLENFCSIPSTAVPNDSIIREFIGGSVFKY